MKIAIIGYSGAGKSTLCKKLADHYKIPYLFLDTVYWLPGWKTRDLDDAKLIVKKFLDSNDSWVIDGNYPKYYYYERMDAADTIIFLDYSRWTCFKQAHSRYKKNLGKTRPDITAGCDETWDTEFKQWILYKGRTPSIKKKYRSVVKQYKDKVVVVKNRKQLGKYLKSIGIV